jgi:hypothetical protein
MCTTNALQLVMMRSAPKIDPVLEKAQYDLEDMIQRSELGGAAVASALPAYVDHKGDIVQ